MTGERWTRNKHGNTGRVAMPSELRAQLHGARVVQPWDAEALGEQARMYDITKADIEHTVFGFGPSNKCAHATCVVCVQPKPEPHPDSLDIIARDPWQHVAKRRWAHQGCKVPACALCVELGMREAPKPEPQRETPRVGDVWRFTRHKDGSTYDYNIGFVDERVRVREPGSPSYCCLAMTVGGVSTTATGSWSLVSRAEPSKPDWRQCATAEEALRAAGFAEPVNPMGNWRRGESSVWRHVLAENEWLGHRTDDALGTHYGADFRAAIAHALGEAP